jgi:CBS domain containing-hemolysin-like protein
MRRNRFSRYPYFDEEGEEVLGVIHLKDLFFAQQSGKHITDLTTSCARSRRFGAHPGARTVPPLPHRRAALRADRRKGQAPGRLHHAGQPAGRDGRRDPRRIPPQRERLAPQGDGTLIGKASLPIFSLERVLGIDIDNEEMGLDEVESVGGLLMAKLGDIPETGPAHRVPGFDVVVKKMNGPRILLVKVIPHCACLCERPWRLRIV